MDRLIADGPRIQDWISGRSGLLKVPYFHGVAREVDGHIVAAFGYDHYQDKSCMMHWGAEPGGITRTLLRRAFWVPFVQWEYNVVLGVVAANNLPSREGAARLGFREVLALPGAHPSGALHWLAMYRAECPWLHENKKNERRIQRTQRTEHVGQCQHGE